MTAHQLRILGHLWINLFTSQSPLLLLPPHPDVCSLTYQVYVTRSQAGLNPWYYTLRADG